MREASKWGAALAALTVTVVGCAEPSAHPAGGSASSGVTAAAPSAVVAPSAAALQVPPPTRTDEGGTGMHYFYWEPAVEIEGSDPQSRAAAVLASARIRELFGAREGDGFVFQSRDDKKPMFTFRQTRAWKDQAVVVQGAYATVELVDERKLSYVGTGFRKGIAPDDRPLAVDERGAGELATQAYEALEKTPGKVTPHGDPGLRVHPVPGKGEILGFAIHVERADGDGFGRPYMFVVDAQAAVVVDQRKSWVE
jgi:hypothetical protein